MMTLFLSLSILLGACALLMGLVACRQSNETGAALAERGRQIEAIGREVMAHTVAIDQLQNPVSSVERAQRGERRHGERRGPHYAPETGRELSHGKHGGGVGAVEEWQLEGRAALLAEEAGE